MWNYNNIICNKSGHLHIYIILYNKHTKHISYIVNIYTKHIEHDYLNVIIIIIADLYYHNY